MATPLLTLDDIHLTFGGTPLLEGASLVVARGDRICLVGRNGSGKSTLMKIAAGLIEPDKGERFLHPDAVVRYLPQEPALDAFETVLAYVEAGLKPTDNPHIARRMLEDLGLDGDARPAGLSGGEVRRASLARILAPRPDILLLDEPTNHLDLPAIEWLEATLARLEAAIVLISHDRRLLERLSRSTVYLDRGRCRHLDQGFSAFEAWRDGEAEREAAERHKLERKIARETEWMHSGGVTARRKRNVRRVAELHTLRARRREWRQATGSAVLAAGDVTASGRLVIEAEGISKSFSETSIVAGLSLRVMRGDRLGLVGPNGAGKTTLIKLLTGEIRPDQGSVRLGSGLELVTLDQKRDALDPEWRLAEALTGGKGDHVHVNGKPRHVQSYMKDFLFSSEQARTPVRVLSGGERARLMLARALARPSNMLVLDEPTNDLDLETLDLLQEMLTDYEGTVLLVSHDRDFLDRIVTSVVAAEGNGLWVEYAGGYSDLEAQRKMRVPAARQGAQTSPVQPPSVGARPEAAPSGPPPAPAAKSRKLSFKEKHALETLPARIEALEAAIARLGDELARQSGARGDPRELTRLGTELGRAETELKTAEDEWLRLELLREESESARG